MGSAAASPPPSGKLTQEELKRVAAHRAVEFVEPGMTLGLGTGSTAAHALDRLGDLLRAGALPGVAGVPPSLKTEAHAARAGIPLLPLPGARIALSIDGADEVDPDLNLVKGRGGSLLREKMIEGAGARFVVIVDESKLVPRLGCTGAIPVEVIPFGALHTLGLIRALFDGLPGFHARLRTVPAAPAKGGEDSDSESEQPFVTDNGNYIVEMFFEDGIRGDLRDISDRLLRITGVVEHGMFLGMATTVIVANKDGTVSVMDRKK
jgi:ribose 5-phosphate isomerase A